MIDLHESMGPVGIKLATPGYVVGLATDCAMGRCEYLLNHQFKHLECAIKTYIFLFLNGLF